MEAVQELQLPAAQVQADNSTLNILLLGPTGVGKSTFINALCNYSVYPSLDEALAGDLQSLIYSEFTSSDYVNNRLVKKIVRIGEPDSLEGAGAGGVKAGVSCTQKCKAYTFHVGETQLIRLIDTPGIGDTRGFDQDVKNMKNVLSFISQYELLHAVCILLKPNEERLTSSLKYCITQLLEKLHKDASSNILFCFTNSRSTSYRVGSTLGLIENMLKPTTRDDFIKLDIKLDEKGTMYHFDSESFRFLASMKNDIQFGDREMKTFRESWEQSTDEAVRLMSHIASLTPHEIKSTLSLNRVRNMLETMQAPLRDISAAIQNNLVEIRKVRKSCDDSRVIFNDISKVLLCTEEYQETVLLQNPRTICTEPSCEGKVCHDKCSPTETTFGILESVKRRAVNFLTSGGSNDIRTRLVDKILPVPVFGTMSEMLTSDSKFLAPLLDRPGDEPLFCSNLSWRKGNCTICRCPNDKHIRVNSERRTATRTVEDENIRRVLDEATGEMEKKQKILTILEVKEESIKAEYDIVLKAAALFSGFLEQNSIVTYHSATPEYLREQIKVMNQCGDHARVAELQGKLDEYDDQVRMFKLGRASNGADSDRSLITEEVVKDEVEKLYALELHGPQLKTWMEGVESEFSFERSVAMKRAEVSFKPAALPHNQSASTHDGTPSNTFIGRIKDSWHMTTGGRSPRTYGGRG
jgi:GTP-binding protein EngB required for normal cell division